MIIEGPTTLILTFGATVVAVAWLVLATVVALALIVTALNP